jgi:dTDP-4-amino-4,6-dideoxygalactose transaminase
MIIISMENAIDEIMAFAQKHDLWVIEDNCE